MIEKLENQLAQVLLYIGALDALAESYRAHESLRHDTFLFGAVYESLWDALIVRLGTFWDRTSGVASLTKLSNHLQGLSSNEARAVVKEIRGSPTPEWIRLKEWRHTVVAHAKFPIDAVIFDGSYQIDIEDVRKEIAKIEILLAKANPCLGRSPVYFQILKDEALAEAKRSLSRWASSAA